jgi:protein-L-isoaspartate(D-aspartate) O-methyltransferase
MYTQQRLELVREIAGEAHYIQNYLGKGEFSEVLLAAMAEVPRHEFVPPNLRHQAYANHPLPIGQGQTISQPFIVAAMTELLGCGPGDKVLEIGTGSGYQAAVLAGIVGHVYTIEIVPELGESARDRLQRLGYGNVTVRVGDGYAGWAEQAPFDGIMVTAAAPDVPKPLVDQLKPGGRLVIPVGGPWLGQDLLVVEKQRDGSVTQRNVLPVAFVPLTGSHGKALEDR